MTGKLPPAEQWSTMEKEELLRETEKARQEWIRASSLIHMMEVPELIDYSIYTLKAAEVRYSYLLRLCKQVNIVKGYLPYSAYRQDSKNGGGETS